MIPTRHISPRGFTIFFAMLVTSLALAIGLAIYDLTVRELALSSTANESQQAIYAADTGAECVLYWDTQCTLSNCTAGSAFPTSTESTVLPSGSGIFCKEQDITTSWDTSARTATAATTTFTLNAANFCATVYVAKSGTPTRTTVTSHGQFNCTSGATDQVERVLQVSY